MKRAGVEGSSAEVTLTCVRFGKKNTTAFLMTPDGGGNLCIQTDLEWKPLRPRRQRPDITFHLGVRFAKNRTAFLMTLPIESRHRRRT